MKKGLVFILVLFVIFAFASCKQEPEPTPTPEPTPVEDDSTVYVMTATAAGDRFQFKWDEVEDSGNQVFTLKYKTDKTVASVTTRDPSASKYIDDGAIAEYITEADEAGWVTFSCTIPEGTHTGFGIAFFVEGGAVAGDVFKVKSIMLGEEEMTLAQENAWAGCSPTITVEE